ncbi:MAG: hypothetical protein A2Y97_10595 [Nitrospirae bacterium RBG_13_39_12]|nr:MAG: hypothetical protein A2Y97_10595 [Nitrospirae bacterium RBG_13_39_12]
MRMKTAKNISVLFFILVAVFYLVHEKYSAPLKHGENTFKTVSTVHDGDTVSIILDNRRKKVRLIGIDAPEISQRPWGMKAKKYMETILSSSGWNVKLEYDVDKRDKYGRILAYLWTTDGELINLLMLKNGYAMLYTFPPNVKHVDELRNAQKEAMDRKIVIWAEKGLSETPADYRREHPRM